MLQFNLIYKTTNLINGKIYVGKHTQNNLEFDGYYGSGIVIKSAVRKYGRENFKREILEVVCLQLSNINEREIYWIEKLDSRNTKIGYNISEGGKGFTSIDSKKLWQDPFVRNLILSGMNSASVIERKSQYMILKWKDEAFRNGRIESLNDPIVKENFSKGMIERWSDLEYKNRVLESKRKASDSQEYRKLRSEISKLKWKDEAFRNDLIKKLKETTNKEEYRKKCSERSKENWKDENYRTNVLQGKNNPELLESLSNKQKQNWKDPVYREKQTELIRQSYKSPEVKLKLSIKNRGSKNPSCKFHYVFKSPTGKIFETDCLAEFCKEHNLDSSSLSRLGNSKILAYKKWTLISKEVRQCH